MPSFYACHYPDDRGPFQRAVERVMEDIRRLRLRDLVYWLERETGRAEFARLVAEAGGSRNLLELFGEHETGATLRQISEALIGWRLTGSNEEMRDTIGLTISGERPMQGDFNQIPKSHYAFIARATGLPHLAGMLKNLDACLGVDQLQARGLPAAGQSLNLLCHAVTLTWYKAVARELDAPLSPDTPAFGPALGVHARELLARLAGFVTTRPAAKQEKARAELLDLITRSRLGQACADWLNKKNAAGQTVLDELRGQHLKPEAAAAAHGGGAEAQSAAHEGTSPAWSETRTHGGASGESPPETEPRTKEEKEKMLAYAGHAELDAKKKAQLEKALTLAQEAGLDHEEKKQLLRALAVSRGPTEALGEIAGQQAIAAAGHQRDKNFIARYHGPDDMTRGTDGTLREWEFKGSHKDSTDVAKDSKGNKQGSEMKNMARAENMVYDKECKIGQSSERQGGAYTVDEINILWMEIYKDDGKKEHYSVHANTETGYYKVYERDSDGKIINKDSLSVEIKKFDVIKLIIEKIFT